MFLSHSLFYFFFFFIIATSQQKKKETPGRRCHKDTGNHLSANPAPEALQEAISRSALDGDKTLVAKCPLCFETYLKGPVAHFRRNCKFSKEFKDYKSRFPPSTHSQKDFDKVGSNGLGAFGSCPIPDVNFLFIFIFFNRPKGRQ